MNRKIIGLLAAMAFLLTACTSAATPPLVRTDTPVETDPPTEVATEAAVDECLACHTDKQRLIDTAAPVVKAESESKGVG